MIRLILCGILIALTASALRAADIAAPNPNANFANFDARAKNGDHLTVVFFGASLTWGANAANPNVTSYRGQMSERLTAAYPQAHFAFHDAAIGGTGSQLGVFRLDRDVLAFKPDLVFVDFSANDDIYGTQPAPLASYEAIVRRIITEAHAPVVQVIFPFMWNTNPKDLPNMKRRDAHLAIAKAYNTAVGDAIALVQDRITKGEVTAQQLWPLDGVHPCEQGYTVFTDAAWAGLTQAIAEKRQCAAPEKMLNDDTYMKNARVRISSLQPLPTGWHVGQPDRTSAFFDMLMSRWLDDVTIASNRAFTADNKMGDTAQVASPLRVHFNAKYVALIGESTAISGPFRVFIDDKPILCHDNNSADESDKHIFIPGKFARLCNGNVHLNYMLADDLDPSVDHTLRIEPIFSSTTAQDLLIESICVAGGNATVKLDP